MRNAGTLHFLDSKHYLLSPFEHVLDASIFVMHNFVAPDLIYTAYDQIQRVKQAQDFSALPRNDNHFCHSERM
jgi:hypothetical protein